MTQCRRAFGRGLPEIFIDSRRDFHVRRAFLSRECCWPVWAFSGAVRPELRHTAAAEEVTGMGSSRLPGFYKMNMAERLRRLAEQLELSRDEMDGLGESGTLPLANADAMIENAVGVLGLPVGIGLNFLVNGDDVMVPMAVEEASVIAAVSLAAKIVREGGGFTADADEPLMIGQVQIAEVAQPEAAREAILKHRAEILDAANALHPAMRARGGGARDVQV